MSDAFDVFLCHHSPDRPEVKEIAERLKQRGLRPWLDEWELVPGRPWQRALEEEIQRIRSAAVFIGEGGFGPWQNLEIEAFLRQFVRRECPVIPVILPSCEEPPELPVFLAGMTWVDFRESEPDPFEQLVWGIQESRTGAGPAPELTRKRPRRAGGRKTSGAGGRRFPRAGWLAAMAALVVLALIFADLYRASSKTIECDDGKRRTIDVRDFVTRNAAYSVELEAAVGAKRLVGKLEPVALRELSASLQQARQFHQFVVAGYNACAISKQQYAEYGARYQAMDSLARQISAFAGRELSAAEAEKLPVLVDELARMARKLGED